LKLSTLFTGFAMVLVSLANYTTGINYLQLDIMVNSIIHELWQGMGGGGDGGSVIDSPNS